MSDHPKRSRDHSSRHRSRERSSSHKRSKHHKRSRSRERYDCQRERHRRHREDKNRERKSEIKIKTEEDFDQRQEEARRKRLERSGGTYCRKRGYSDMKEIKQEKHDPDSGNEHSGIHLRGPEGQYRGSANRYDHPSRHDFKQERSSKPEPPVEKEKPNLGLSGALTADTNTFRGVVIKYSEPPEARVPKKRWRLYPFKEDQTFDTIHLHRQSGYLMGRLRRVVDIAIDHPSCSKQHAAFQFRAVEKVIKGVKKLVVRPYIMDLNSGNGTFLNGEKIEAQRYYELKERDVLRFGTSIRDYVLLHQNSDTSEIAAREEDEDDVSE